MLTSVVRTTFMKIGFDKKSCNLVTDADEKSTLLRAMIDIMMIMVIIQFEEILKLMAMMETVLETINDIFMFLIFNILSILMKPVGSLMNTF